MTFCSCSLSQFARLRRLIRPQWQLRRRWAGTEAGRRDLGSEVVPELIALSNRVEALTHELHAKAHHDVRPLLASARHHRRQRP